MDTITVGQQVVLKRDVARTPLTVRKIVREPLEGHTAGVTVSDGSKTYRLSNDTARLVSKGGRPALSDEANVKVEIVMPRSLAAKLDRLAPNGNRSAWIRQAIEAAGEPAKEGLR